LIQNKANFKKKFDQKEEREEGKERRGRERTYIYIERKRDESKRA
jgi:hypothetical protein